MTIIFQGHVERIERGFGGKLDVHVQTASAECGQVLVLHAPADAGAHWMPGRMVSITAYAFDPVEPSAVAVQAAELRSR